MAAPAPGHRPELPLPPTNPNVSMISKCRWSISRLLPGPLSRIPFNACLQDFADAQAGQDRPVASPPGRTYPLTACPGCVHQVATEDGRAEGKWPTWLLPGERSFQARPATAPRMTTTPMAIR